MTPLEPGRYLIVVEVAGFGFHEVYRRVPDDPASLPSIFAVERWEKPIDGVVPLPTITVWQNGLAESKMVYVAGGEFEMGAGLDDSSPRHRRKVNDFYMDETEVCVADYETIRPARHADDFDTSLLRLPKRSVDWAAAAHVAEAMGKRLPMEDEFEFAATNRGTTTFPWGEEPLAAGITEIQSVDVKTIDVCRDFPIRNMISNVAELTNSVPGAYPGSAAQKVELIADSKGMNRIVRGGWKQQSADEHRAKQRESIFCLASDPNLGFRCARSKRPSY